MSLDDRLPTLSGLWSAWAATGEGLIDGQWARPTRLGDWDVRCLIRPPGPPATGIRMPRCEQ